MTSALRYRARAFIPTGPYGTPRGHGPLLAVLLALLTALPVIAGKLQLLDVVCLALLPLLSSRALRDRRLLLVGAALLVWAVGQLLSNQVNGGGLAFTIELVAAVTILAVTVFLVTLADGDQDRLCWALAGVAAGLGLQLLLVQGISFGSPTAWKFGFGQPISLLLLALTDLAWRRGFRLPSVVALGAVCAISITADDRHRAAVALLTAVLVLVPHQRDPHPRVRSVVLGVLLLVAALSGVFFQSAQAGWLGDRSAVQIAQWGSNPYVLLVNVRPEFLQSFYLFSTRPLTGFGAYPHLDRTTFEQSLTFLQSMGIDRPDLRDIWLHADGPGLAAHSAALDTWVRAGLAAVPFWLLLWALALWSGTSAITRRSSPLLVFWTVMILWDTVFSPMAALTRIDVAAYLSLALTTLGVSATRRMRPP